MMPTKISELGAASAYTADDLTVMVQSGTTVQSTMGDQRDYHRTQVRWRLVETSKYTASPASTSRITMSDTSDMAVGLPIRYTITGDGGTNRYGIVTAVSSNSYIDVAGVSLSAALTGLWAGVRSSVVVDWIYISGQYCTSTSSTAIATYGNQFRKWRHGSAQVVQFSASHATADTGAMQPYVNVMVGGSEACGDNSDKGPILTTAGSIVTNAAAGLTADDALVAFDDAIELKITEGTNADGEDLTVCIVYVLE